MQKGHDFLQNSRKPRERERERERVNNSLEFCTTNLTTTSSFDDVVVSV